jgi:hypothetical protein
VVKWHESRFEPTANNGSAQWLAAQVKRARSGGGVCRQRPARADVLEACESARLAVPDGVAIVSTGDYLLAPDAMHTPISSVTRTEFRYRGAEL